MCHHLWMTCGPILYYHLLLCWLTPISIFLTQQSFLPWLHFHSLVLIFLSGPLDEPFKLHSPKFRAMTCFCVGRWSLIFIRWFNLHPNLGLNRIIGSLHNFSSTINLDASDSRDYLSQLARWLHFNSAFAQLLTNTSTSMCESMTIVDISHLIARIFSLALLMDFTKARFLVA